MRGAWCTVSIKESNTYILLTCNFWQQGPCEQTSSLRGMPFLLQSQNTSSEVLLVHFQSVITHLYVTTIACMHTNSFLLYSLRVHMHNAQQDCFDTYLSVVFIIKQEQGSFMSPDVAQQTSIRHI